MYDAIIVGARVAGSATALLLARGGYRVLLVDRATFPSDTLSTHQIQIPGSVRLKRWGLLDQVLATDPGAVGQVRLTTGDVTLSGSYPSLDEINTIISPRRFLLDTILVEAADHAGAEVQQGTTIDELLWEDGRVVGVHGHSPTGATITERARVVIGADGKHSLVAKAVSALTYDVRPPLTCGYYAYWDGIPTQGGDIYQLDRRAIGLWPTNQQQTLIYVAWPATEFPAFRSDVEGSFMGTIDRLPELSERVRQGHRAERFRGTGEMPNFYRRPFGAGWALVGDAGYVKDPITAFGISDALRDAELLATALDDGFSGQEPLQEALRSYERQRNAASKPFYDLTMQTARLKPLTSIQLELLRALQQNPAAASRFFGVLSAVVKPTEFFSLPNILQIVGIRGATRMMRSMFVHPQSQRRTA
jgi:flavin-dependent dehydrogenase